MQILYSSDVVGAALGFVNELQHHKSRVLEKTVDMTDEPGAPASLTERVLHSFARHDIPVDRPVSLPLISVDMYCPGMSSSKCYSVIDRLCSCALPGVSKICSAELMYIYWLKMTWVF